MEKKSDIVFLMGMPGSGKSYWGRVLTNEYLFNYVDLDHAIEQHEQKTISEIFEEKDEAYFRTLETEILKNITAEEEQPLLVSVGGGTPCFHNNLDFMKSNGTTIYLSASVQTLVEKLKTDFLKRPLLADQETFMEEKLKKLLNQRKHYYEQADHILQVETLNLDDFKKIIPA